MRTINITVDCDNDEQAYYLEQHIRANYKVKDCTWIPDSKDLYNTDSTYRKKWKELKEYKKEFYNYIKSKT